MDVLQLLEYLQDILENASKVPMTGKVLVDKNEVVDIIDQIVNYLPDEFKKAQWVISEKERILSEANKEYEDVKKQTMDMLRKQVENHDITKEATIKSQEIISQAQRDAKAIRLGARDYADEILCQLDNEIQEKIKTMMGSMKENIEGFMKSIADSSASTSNTIRDNVKELRNMK
ncbi:ATPase [Clostridium sp. 19966]|uniref:ATPase n=1 Tax=Clostridium sp. 19966 TaxID=2768166 RepID=UPI0028DEE0BB|nr:ATPase [Clostridium sp. 19966]MDT8716461.1 ATPase [Clostridium sp. 19966]